MDNNNIKLIYQINKLIQINLDRSKGYQKAKELISSAILKDLFEECSSQSDSYVCKLRTTLFFHGVPIRKRTSISGSFYRLWMQIRAPLSRNRSKAVLKSCREAENIVFMQYNFTLENQYLRYSFPLLERTLIKQRAGMERMQAKIEAALAVESQNYIPARSLVAENETVMSNG